MEGTIARAGSIGVRGTYLSEDSVAVVGQDNTSHGVEQHLEHRLGSEGGSDDVSNGLGSSNVSFLSSLSLLTLSVPVKDHNGRLIVHFHFRLIQIIAKELSTPK